MVIWSCNSNKQPSTFDNSPDVRQTFDLKDIQENGELIVLTQYGPDTYFEFRGEYFGRQYLIADAYARSIGTRMRVEICRSADEMQKKLSAGDGDIIACNIPDSLKSDNNSYISADTIIRAWAVSKNCPELADNLKMWVRNNSDHLIELSTIKYHSRYGGRRYTPRRRISAPILNMAKGEISEYDRLFKENSRIIGWDWRLLAAQAYQESTFDPDAVSFMGAMGLMQLMPSTAKIVGVSIKNVFMPEHNVRGAVKLIGILNQHYAGIKNESERINFILAAYNAGSGHVDDARRLAQKYGKDPNRWLGNVDGYVLRMSEERFYNQPEVQHGYFRGSETYDYVNSIRTRWDEYRRKIR